MLQISVMLSLSCASILAATSTTVESITARTFSSLNCESVQSDFEIQGFQISHIPKEPISSKELKICGGLSSGGQVCCSSEMETLLQERIRDKHDKVIRDSLQRLQTILHNRAVRFHEFFNDLLKTSKKSFHEMFKKTYGILYEQNAYVFIDLFRELEKYYIKGSVDLDDVMDTFFNTLYQKMFTVLNSQYKFDNKYLECVGHHMKEMRPFGDVPQKLGVQIKRSFIATRAFSQALQVASEVLKNMQQVKASNECIAALLRMTACPLCNGVHGNILACNDMCGNVMKGCLAQHAALDADWNHFVEAVDKVADRLLGPFNIEMLVRPINLKISEAIMNFQESSSDVSHRVFSGCGRPMLGRRRRRRTEKRKKEIDEQKSLNFEKNSEVFEEDAEERSSTAIILDKLVKEIKQRIRDSRQFWLYLPYKLCNDGLVVPPSNTRNCWNGTHIDKYIYPLSPNGELQNLNPEVRALGPRTTLVKEQIFALNGISNRLRLAFNGHDVDWIDSEEDWTSGSGSGFNLDPITDDEDGFSEGSGHETTVRSIDDLRNNSMKPPEKENDAISSTLPTPIRVHDRKQELTSSLQPNVDVKYSSNKTLNRKQSLTNGCTGVIPKLTFSSKILSSYFFALTVVWCSSWILR